MRITNPSLAVLLVVFILSAPPSARAGGVTILSIGLTADAVNSDPNTAGGTHAGTLSDTFAYNYLSPTSPLPFQAYGGGPTAFHGGEAEGVDANIFFNLTGGPLSNLKGTLTLDLYGRNNCCTVRDNNFDIRLRNGGFSGPVVASLTGLGIADGVPHHVRATFPESSLISITFDTIEIVGHDTTTEAGNAYTLMELRAFATVVPEPATAGLLGIGLVGMTLRRRRK